MLLFCYFFGSSLVYEGAKYDILVKSHYSWKNTQLFLDLAKTSEGSKLVIHFVFSFPNTITSNFKGLDLISKVNEQSVLRSIYAIGLDSVDEREVRKEGSDTDPGGIPTRVRCTCSLYF